MAPGFAIQQLWTAAEPSAGRFDPASLAPLPGAARRYLGHAIAAGTPLASAVRLEMHGEIKLGSWRKFTAEQVIHSRRGMIWAASVKMFGLPVTGFDRIIDGEGEMRWKLLGLIPVVTGKGPPVTRSALGRVAGESVWLPSVLLLPGAVWSEPDPAHPHVQVTEYGETTDIGLAIDGTGRVASVKLQRWGNPDGGPYRYVDFGVLAEEERTFDGYTIPSRIRAGWYFGSPRFELEGEFFRAEIDRAEYR